MTVAEKMTGVALAVIVMPRSVTCAAEGRMSTCGTRLHAPVTKRAVDVGIALSATFERVPAAVWKPTPHAGVDEPALRVSVRFARVVASPLRETRHSPAASGGAPGASVSNSRTAEACPTMLRSGVVGATENGEHGTLPNKFMTIPEMGAHRNADAPAAASAARSVLQLPVTEQNSSLAVAASTLNTRRRETNDAETDCVCDCNCVADEIDDGERLGEVLIDAVTLWEETAEGEGRGDCDTLRELVGVRVSRVDWETLTLDEAL